MNSTSGYVFFLHIYLRHVLLIQNLLTKAIQKRIVINFQIMGEIYLPICEISEFFLTIQFLRDTLISQIHHILIKS